MTFLTAGPALNLWPWLLILVGLGCLALAGLRTWNYLQYRKRRRGRKNQKLDMLTIGLYIAAALVLLLALLTAGGGTTEPTGNPSDSELNPSGTSEPIEDPSGSEPNPSGTTGSTDGTTEPTGPQFGWRSDESGTYYLKEDGTKATGWLDLDNRRYYLDENGYTLSGWQELEGILRYFRADGSMARGEEEIDGKTYFFTSTGTQIDLVNPWHAVPEDYTVELRDLSVIYATEGIRVDVRIYDALIDMMDACNDAAPRCCVTSGYRSMEDQEELYNNQVNRHLNEGYTREEAEAEAATAVAVPGTSEHQIGLAVDIVDTRSWSLDEFQDDLPAQQWLMEHSWEYGFILRYPEDKTDVTGIIYEPWHYRYVGLELAKEIFDSGLTLEEYLDNLD